VTQAYTPTPEDLATARKVLAWRRAWLQAHEPWATHSMTWLALAEDELPDAPEPEEASAWPLSECLN
jgi:hypothetical protein